MAKFKKVRYPSLKPSISPSALQRIAKRSGHTLMELHALWESRKRGHLKADEKLKSLVAAQPEIMKVLERFSAGADREKNGLHMAITKADIVKKPESIWTQAKLKWLSFESGGLPTLGKRR